MFLEFFHVCTFTIDFFALWYDQVYIDAPFPYKEMETMPFKARHLYLTVWSLVFQILYYFVSFLNDIHGTNSETPKKPPLIKKIKDIMFCVAFTLAIYVSVTFWVMCTIHKELIYPTSVSSKIPDWLNHILHTTVSIFIVIEMFVTKPQYPSRKLGFGLVMTIIFSYVIYVHVVYFAMAIWPYPFMAYFGWPMRIVFHAVSGAFGYNVYVLGEHLSKQLSSKNSLHANGVNRIKKIY